MTPFLAEIVGTALLVLLGNGVVANALLADTKGHGAGWITITAGWGMAVFVAVFVAGPFSGAHINPAVTVALAAAGKFGWGSVPAYLLAQTLGGALGAVLVWAHHHPHWGRTEDTDAKLAAFCTAPAVRATPWNLLSETIGTFVLVLGVLYLAAPEVGLGALDALPVGLLVFAIGMSLGGTTGYAINPARDLPPRVVHALLPIAGKGGSDFAYAWVPVVGPILGGLLAAGTYLALEGPAFQL